MPGFNEYLFIAIAYLLGSVAFGSILTRICGFGDISKQGSGNIGATNVVRVAGKKLGAATFLLDFLKGFLPAFIYSQIISDALAVYIVAMASVVGHIFPIWNKFKGGKGVATGFGAILAVSYMLLLVAIGFWVATYKLKKISSLSALVSYGLLPFVSFFIYPENKYLMIFLFILSVIVFVRHKANIKRLLNGEEGKIK